MSLDPAGFEQLMRERGLKTLEFCRAVSGHTKTVISAAHALGLDPASSWRISKTLLWVETKPTNRRFYIFCAGTHRVDPNRVSSIAKDNWDAAFLKSASPFAVQAFTGFSVGALPPFPDPSRESTFEWHALFDERLLSDIGIDSRIYVAGPRVDGLYAIHPQELWDAWIGWAGIESVQRW